MAKALAIALWVQVAGIPDPPPRAGLRAPADFLSFLPFRLWGTPTSFSQGPSGPPSLLAEVSTSNPTGQAGSEFITLSPHFGHSHRETESQKAPKLNPHT